MHRRRLSRMASRLVALTAMSLSWLLLAAAGAAGAAAPPLVPPDGRVYFGAHLDWETDSPSAYSNRTGVSAAQYGTFTQFPLTSADKTRLSGRVSAIGAAGGRLFLTVEPTGGLATVTRTNARELARAVAGYNGRGVPVYVRFAHEMNGSWYAWGQQPAAYVSAFRKIANAIHTLAPASAVLWSPNYAGGYPYAGGQYAAQPGTADFTALDTDHDGRLTMTDNPYSPYYPGDAYVDWVGLTDYHWGSRWPWGENEAPEQGKLAAQLTGTYSGLAGDETAVPNFYRVYAVTHAKPMALSETAALYNEAQAGVGAGEWDIKSGWMGEVFGESFATAFPQVKMVNWFEQRKHETEVAATVDWRLTADPELRDRLVGYLRTPRYQYP